MKPFERYHLYHGANGDKILSIIASGEIRPNHKGEVFFSQFEWADCLMHGYDEKRKATGRIEFTCDTVLCGLRHVGRVYRYVDRVYRSGQSVR